MDSVRKTRQHWVFCSGAVTMWIALGWPGVRMYLGGETIRGVTVTDAWIAAYAVFGLAVICAMAPRERGRLFWPLLFAQVGAAAAMAYLISWAGMSMFLTIIAWQVAMATSPGRALAWVAAQTTIVVIALAQALNPDLCWVIAKSLALQLLLVFTASTLRREAGTARALAATNEELRAAQAIIATTVRDAERLRISRELHDAWGHELTALGLQLEIASHLTEPAKANAHVQKAKTLARDLLGKVRDVVSTLREAERGDLRQALETLARSVPVPAVHVDIAPDLRVSPDQAHALMRCAQEAVTNAVRHAEAANLWLQVSADGDGVRLIARDDGNPQTVAASSGSGLVGMRERVEALGGRLAVRPGAGFTVEAWLPTGSPQAA